MATPTMRRAITASSSRWRDDQAGAVVATSGRSRLSDRFNVSRMIRKRSAFSCTGAEAFVLRTRSRMALNCAAKTSRFASSRTRNNERMATMTVGTTSL
jgi:hypothetical protein